MRGRAMKAAACLVAVLIIGGPVAADDFTGSEREMRTLSCKGPYPSNQEPPGPGECTGTQTTYRGYVWTNNVKCNGGSAANAEGIRVYHNPQGTTGGGVGVCNDGTGAVGSKVIQGRAAASGSPNGGTVYVDGDKDNTQHDSLQGWLRIDGKPGAAPTVRCGDDNGRKDATMPTSADQQDDCG